MTDVTAEKIKALSMMDFSCADEFRSPIARISVDERLLNLFIQFANSKSRDEILITQAIRAGIRQSQLESLKGTSRREYDDKRKRMGLPEHSKGRIEQLSMEDELILLREWEKLSDIPDELERYVVLNQRTGISIDRAWITVKQVEADA